MPKILIYEWKTYYPNRPRNSRFIYEKMRAVIRKNFRFVPNALKKK
jgi:hypothetical protein